MKPQWHMLTKTERRMGTESCKAILAALDGEITWAQAQEICRRTGLRLRGKTEEKTMTQLVLGKGGEY